MNIRKPDKSEEINWKYFDVINKSYELNTIVFGHQIFKKSILFGKRLNL